MPDALAQRAQALADDQSVTLGSTESYPLPGVTTLIRVEPHVWAKNAQGDFTEGCFRVGGVYLLASDPSAAGVATAAASSDGLSKTIGILTVASLAIGTAATLASWGKK